MMEIARLVVTAISVVVAFLTLSTIRQLVSKGGPSRIREVREEGGGVRAMLRGELRGGQRRPTSARAHGLHLEVAEDGVVEYREKSVIAREVA